MDMVRLERRVELALRTSIFDVKKMGRGQKKPCQESKKQILVRSLQILSTEEEQSEVLRYSI